jgi:hypothetical protein
MRLLLAYIRRPPPLPQIANSQTKYSCLGDLSLLPLFAAFFCISIACTAHSTGESRASGTSSCCWDLGRDRWAIRFLGSVFTQLLTPVRLLPLRRRRMNERLLPLLRLRANDYFTYSGSALRSSTCIDCVRLHPLRHSQWVITEIRVTPSPKLPQGTLSNQCSCLLVV